MELAGNLGEILLPQLIENIYLKKQTGHLRIRHAQQASTLSFQEGELVDAEFGEEVGPEAVYLAMSLPAEAAYEFEPGTVASRRTIDEPWQRVVLKGFCRFKDAKVTKRSSGTRGGTRGETRGMPAAAAAKNLSLPPLDELSPPPSPPRHQLSIKSVAVGSVMTAVVVVVVSAAVAIASYSGKLSEGKRSKARPSSGTPSAVVPAAPAAPHAGAPSSLKMTESVPAQSVDDASGRDSAAGQAEGPGTDGIAKPIETAGRTAMTARASAPADEATPAERSGSEVTTEDWFVILKTFPKKERGRAAESGKHFKDLGHNARVVDTDDFPNFRGGMWAVMLGPYSQEAATEMAHRLRTQIPDVYAKPGGTSSRRE